jgi:uncharacterized protein (DUF2147 family)
MRKTFSLFVLFLTVSGLCFSADPLEGFWLSIDEKTNEITAGWQIYQEGGKLYGKILSSKQGSKNELAAKCKDSYPDFPVQGKVSAMPVFGTPWIFGLTMSKTGEWIGGRIINPEDGNIYRCKLTFHAADGKKFQSDTLEMRGEIGLGIGRSQYWRKTDEQTAGNLWSN